MKLLKPDATTDGKIIFNFELDGKLKGEVITIIKEIDFEGEVELIEE
jgi:hypothetical protein